MAIENVGPGGVGNNYGVRETVARERYDLTKEYIEEYTDVEGTVVTGNVDPVTGGIEFLADGKRKNIVRSHINDFLTTEEISDAKSRNPVIDVGQKINAAIQASAFLEFDSASVYLSSQQILINKPMFFGSTGTWATLVAGNTGVQQTSIGVATIKCANGFSGDFMRVGAASVGATVKGLLLDCQGQLSGNGIYVEGSSNYRSNRQFSEVCVYSAASAGVVINSAKEDYFSRVYTRDSRGGSGFDILGSDLFFEYCFASKNTGSGFHWREGSAAGRFTRCDSWDNDEYGVLLEGQNASFLSLQVDLNELGGVRIKKASVESVAPKRFQFIGGNSLGNGTGAADFHFSDNASNVSILGWNFGYGHSSDPALYAVIDDSIGAVGNSIVGCSFEKSAYKNLLSPNIMRYWATQGHSADFGMLSQAASDGTDLLVNGDFETWVSGAGGVPAGWSAVSGNGSSAINSTFGFSNYAVTLTASSADTTQGIQQTLDVHPGELKNKRVTVVGVVQATGTEQKFVEIREGGSVTQYPVVADGVTRTFSVYRDITSSNDITIRLTNKTAGDGSTTGTMIVDRLVCAVGSAIDSISKSRQQPTCGFGTLAASATPSVRGYANWIVSESTAITNFTGGYEGKEVVIVGNGSVSIAHGSSIKTKSGLSLTIADGAAATFRYVNNAWREI